VILGAGAYGVVGDVVIGMLGAVIGGWLAPKVLNVNLPGLSANSIATAMAGTIILMALFRAIAPSRWSRVRVWRR
jgi:uncharacterized membrane protein YeaQ/YmgE (transglycosylase-associated protein family)